MAIQSINSDQRWFPNFAGKLAILRRAVAHATRVHVPRNRRKLMCAMFLLTDDRDVVSGCGGGHVHVCGFDPEMAGIPDMKVNYAAQSS